MLNLLRRLVTEHQRVIGVTLFITMHCFYLGVWGLMMRAGTLEPQWIFWRIYALTAIVFVALSLRKEIVDEVIFILITFVVGWGMIVCVNCLAAIIFWQSILSWWPETFASMMAISWLISMLWSLWVFS